jgi:hypothetical protein
MFLPLAGGGLLCGALEAALGASKLYRGKIHRVDPQFAILKRPSNSH